MITPLAFVASCCFCENWESIRDLLFDWLVEFEKKIDRELPKSVFLLYLPGCKRLLQLT